MYIPTLKCDMDNGNEISTTLVSHIREPTRITSETSTCLDQIITNTPNYIKEPTVSPPIANCDHCVISAKLLFRRKKESSYPRLIWQYNKADFDSFRGHLNQVNWDNFFVSEDINERC